MEYSIQALAVLAGAFKPRVAYSLNPLGDSGVGETVTFFGDVLVVGTLGITVIVPRVGLHAAHWYIRCLASMSIAAA